MSDVSLEIHESIAVVRLTHGVPNGISLGVINEMRQLLLEVKAKAAEPKISTWTGNW